MSGTTANRAGKGDDGAWDEMMRAVVIRTERLARAMLRGYPNVRRLADTGDLLQGALVRLMTTLKQLRPAS